MPPGPVMTGSRPLTKPPKPPRVRYFKGKAPDAARSDSDSDSDEQEAVPEPPKPERRYDPQLVAGGAGRVLPDKPARTAGEVKVELGGVQLGRGGAVKQEEDESEYETDEEDEEVAATGARPLPAAKAEESSEYETDSEEESESEEDVKPAHRPVFVPKNKRGVTQEKLAAEAEERLKQQEEMEAQRKLDSKELAGETIRREIAEREAAEIQPDVDDTDGLDPSAEFDEWRARELARLLRDKQAQAERDEEREEIERRRAMPEDQRLAEDLAHAAETRAREKGQMGFLQKYYHKGAFHQEDELLSRDYTGATDGAVDMSMLPKVMQVRDYGKMSRSKYTHLTDQDTTQGGWGAAARQAGPGGQGQQQGCWNCGGPHLRKDCPNDDVNNPNRLGAGAAGPGSSANGAALGSGALGGHSWGREGDDGRFGAARDQQGRYPGEERRRDERPEGSRHGAEKRHERATYDERDRYGDRDRAGYDERDRNRDRGYDRDRRRSEDGYGRADRRRDERSRSRSPNRRDRERERKGDGRNERRGDHDRRREADRDRGDDRRRRYD